MSENEPYRSPESDPSLGELAGRLTDDFGMLVQDHLALAKLEIVEEVKTASKGACLLGGGAIAGYFALVMFCFAVAWTLAAVMPADVAFAVMGALWALVAGVLALLGRREIKETDPKPTQTIAEVKEDTRWVRKQTN